jgi:hypothetical protein
MSVQSLQNQPLELRELTVSNAYEAQATGYVAQSTIISPSSVSSAEISISNGITIPPTLSASTTANNTLVISKQLQIANGTTIPVLLSSSETVNNALSVQEIELPNADPTLYSYITNSAGGVGLSSAASASPLVLSQGTVSSSLSVPTTNGLSIDGQMTAQSLAIDNGVTIPPTLTASTNGNNTLIISDVLQISNGITVPPTLSSSSTLNGVLRLSGSIQITGGILDSAGSAGTNGQVLTSNGTGYYWA